MKYLSPPIFLFSLLLLGSYIAHGRTDTIFYNKQWQIAPRAEAAFYRVYFKDKDQYRTEDRYFGTNKLQMTGYYTSKDSGARNGIFIFYDKDGFTKQEERYDHNKPVGDWKYYYPTSKKTWYTNKYVNNELTELDSYYQSGKLKRKEFYKDNKPYGKCYDENGKEIPYTPFEVKPEPKFDMSTYLSNNIHYPESARENSIEGRVIIKFYIDEHGNVGDAEVIRTVYNECDEEALRVVSNMPKWSPGIQDDKPVKVYYTLPIVFKLTD